MDHFAISFACSIFSKSWEVTNHVFLGVAHLPVCWGGGGYSWGVFLIRTGFLGAINPAAQLVCIRFFISMYFGIAALDLQRPEVLKYEIPRRSEQN